MNLTKGFLQQWVTVENYRLMVHEWLDESILDTGVRPAQRVRALRILVEYDNRTADPLPFRLSQWQLFDTDGFSYEFELRNQFYGADGSRKLREGQLAPQREARGWVAFQLPENAHYSHVQFRSGYLSQEVANIYLSLPDGAPVVVDKRPFKQENSPKKWRWPFSTRENKAQVTASLLIPQQRYLLAKNLIDHFGNSFVADTPLTFERQLPTYKGLYFLQFAEGMIYLQEETHADILGEIGRYFIPV